MRWSPVTVIIIIMSNRGFGYTKTGRLSGTLEPVSNSIPEAGDDEVVIKIKAMALNPVDEQLCVGPRCFQAGAHETEPSLRLTT